MLANQSPAIGVFKSGIAREWFTGGTGWAYVVRNIQLSRTQSTENAGLIRLNDGRKSSNSSALLMEK